MPETERNEPADGGAQQDREDRQHRDEIPAPDTYRGESPEGRDVPPTDAARDRKSPWLGGG